MSKSPKVGPYGETYFNERTGKRQVRLTEQGKELVLRHMDQYPNPLALPLRFYTNLTRYIIAVEGRESANALAVQGVVVAVAKWEPERASMVKSILLWTRSAFKHIASSRASAKNRPANGQVSFDRVMVGHYGRPESSVNLTIDPKQIDPSELAEHEDFASVAFAKLRMLPSNHADILRKIYGGGMTTRDAGKAIGGYSAEYSCQLRNDAMSRLRRQMGILPSDLQGE